MSWVIIEEMSTDNTTIAIDIAADGAVTGVQVRGDFDETLLTSLTKTALENAATSRTTLNPGHADRVQAALYAARGNLSRVRPDYRQYTKRQEFDALIIEIAENMVRRGLQPAPIIAKAFETSEATAYRWIQDARQKTGTR